MIAEAEPGAADARRKLFIDIFGFQLVWIASALGAANGTSFPGIAASVAFIVLQLVRSGRTPAMFQIVVFAGLCGLLAESLLAATGLIRHSAPWPSQLMAPAWMVALWMAFGTTVGTLGGMLGRCPLPAAAAVGALLGPCSYVAGAGIGALTLTGPTVASIIGISLIWSAALPFLLLVWAKVGLSQRMVAD